MTSVREDYNKLFITWGLAAYRDHMDAKEEDCICPDRTSSLAELLPDIESAFAKGPLLWELEQGDSAVPGNIKLGGLVQIPSILEM